jgi:H+/Cl- antiporter ClcA
MDESASFEQHWTLDPQLRSSFFLASVIGTTVFVLGVLANIFSVDEKTMPLLRSLPFEIIGVFIGVTGSVSALWLLIGMWSYCWQADRRQHGLSITWLLALAIGNWVGATVYYFLVFRRIADQIPINLEGER